MKEGEHMANHLKKEPMEEGRGRRKKEGRKEGRKNEGYRSTKKE